MTLPLLISVPHAGLAVPPTVASICSLSAAEVARDGDEGAADIYDIASEVAAYATTDVARAIVDLNRAEDDRRQDGAIKTHTCWDVPVYRTPPTSEVIETLLATYYRPYHRGLTERAEENLLLAVDCHTMAAVGPPVAPDAGQVRPWVCLGNADGTCPQTWMDALRACFETEFGARVTHNEPFRGGYITRSHAQEMPWVQLELSRAPFLSNAEKRLRLLRALDVWTHSQA